MSNSGIKISALTNTDSIPEGGEVAIAVGGNISQTFGATLTALRSALLFENAYSTVKDGIKGTSDGEIFFVYTDTNKSHVLGYTNVNGTNASALTDDDGTQVRYGTYVSLANGGGSDVSNYIDWEYNNGSATGGEKTFTISTACLDVRAIWVGGSRKFKSINFTFNVSNQTVTLDDALTAGDLVVCEILPTFGSNTVSPDISNYVNVSWVYNSGSANGGESTITPPYSFNTVPAVYLNGARQVLGYQYTVNGMTSIALASPLKKGDFLQVILGGESTEMAVDMSALSQLNQYGQGNQKDLITVDEEGTTLYDLVKKLPYFAGSTLPQGYKSWSAGATSTYNNVWRWTDGTLWTSFSGVLPEKPSPLTMQIYDRTTDIATIEKIIAQIAVSDETNSTLGTKNLKAQLAMALLGSNQVMTNGGVSGNGTSGSPISIAATLNSLGMGAWPDFTLSGSVVPKTLTASEAGPNSYPGVVNAYSLSNSVDLGITKSYTMNCSVFTGVIQKGRLFRMSVDSGGNMRMRIMPSDWSWGSSPWRMFYHTGNTTVASDGTLSAASPIVRVVDSVDNSERTDLLSSEFEKVSDYAVVNNEASGVTVTKESTGVYIITGCDGLYSDGWQIKDAYTVQGNTPVALGRAISQDDGSVKVSVYARKMILNNETMEITQTLGDLIDIPLTSWIDVRVNMSEKNNDDPDVLFKDTEGS